MLFGLLRLLCLVLFRVNVKGDKALLQQPRLLLTPNHVSFLDGLLLAVFLPIKPIFAVYSQYLDHWLFRLLAKIVNIVPLDPMKPMSIKTLVKMVGKQPIVVFPEGRLSLTGSLMKVYDGAAFIAAKSRANVVPVVIQGAELSYFSRLKKPFKRRLFPKITITLLPTAHITIPTLFSARARRLDMGEQLLRIMQTAKVLSRRRMTLFQALQVSARRYGYNKKIIEDVNLQPNRYRQLLSKSLALGRLLRRHTQLEQNVGLLLPNTIAMAAALFGLSAYRRVPALLNYSAGVAGLANALKAAAIEQIVTSRQFLQKAKLTHLPQQLTQVHWCYLEDLATQITFTDKVAIVFYRFFPVMLSMRRQQTDERALILFTSGSEGAAKGVVHSHDSLLANVTQIQAIADFTPNDCFMTALPLFHAFGLTASLLLPLYSGARVFLYPTPLHYRLIPEWVYDKNCTVLMGTATFLQQYGRFAHPYDFARVRYVVAGAEKLPVTVQQQWQDKFGIRILEGYGATECAPVIAINTPMVAKSGTVGCLLPGMQSRLLAVEGIAQGKLLQVAGPNVMLGYLRVDRPNQLEKTYAENAQGVQEANWYDTGDIVEMDHQGFIRIVGRVKRFAKIAGEMVSLEMVEQLVSQIAKEKLHAVISRSDSNKGEALVLFTTDANLSRQQILSAAQQQGLTELAVPRDIRYVKQLPLLATGKVDYITLKQWLEQPDD